MILTYHEGACIRASAGDTTLVFGPVSKKSKNFKPVNFGADVAFVSLNHPDMNGAGEAARGERQPFLIYGPGEYEVSAKGGSASGGKDSVTASGFAAGSTYGGDPLTNTIYSVKFDGLSVLYLGALVEAGLPRGGGAKWLPLVFLPPPGGGAAPRGPAEAGKLAVKLEAKIIIPVLFDDKSLKQFLKEAGAEGVKPTDKLTIKPRDVAGKQSEVVVLSS